MSLGVGVVSRRCRRAALTLLVLTVLPRAAHAQSGECEDVPGERELRSLSFVGNQAFSSRELALRVATTPSSFWRRSVRAFGTRRCLDSDVLRLDVGRLRVFYQRHGYYGASVDTAVTTEVDGSVRVAFVIAEGIPVRIDSLSIEGLDTATRALADTGRVDLRKGAVFDRTVLQATIDSIKTRLRNNGYPRADVAASYTVDTVQHVARVDLDVIAGNRARIGEIRVFSEPLSGDAARIGAPTVERLSSVRTGDLYRERDLAEAQRGLYQTDLFQKAEVRIAPDSVQPKGDSLVTIDILLRENYLRQVETELGWAVLDCFKERTTYIDKNFLGEARRLELTAQVSKVGYASPTRLANGNLCAPAIRDDSAFSSKLNYYTSASVRLPTFFGYRTSPTFSVYSERRSEYQAYLRTTLVGGEASVTREVGRGLPLRLAYSLEFGRTEAPPALLCALFSKCDAQSREFMEKNRRLAVTSAHLDRVRTDNPLNPRDGTVLRFDVRTAFRELGSDSALQFTKLLGDASFYRPLSSGVTFAARLRIGTVLGRTLSFADSAGFIPPEERLYAGGPTSVRGFQQNSLGDLIYIAETGPRRIQGQGDTVYFELGARNAPGDSQVVRRVVPVGGTSLVVANVELRLRSPLFPELLQYTLFADAGDVWQRGTEIGSRAHKASALFLNGLKWTPGIGVRVFTPVGPFQANVGYNPFPQPPGAIYYDAPNTQGFVLYCVTPGNNIPATPNPSNGNVLEQDPSRSCRNDFSPERPSGFLRHLTFTFSIGPDF